jgi:hypothetical protein
MADYGSNSEVQLLAFGSVDAAQDTRSESARKIATTKINSILDLSTDISSPSAAVTNVCNLLAAGLILTGQFTVDAIKEHPFYTLAMGMLEDIRGDTTTDAGWGRTIPVERF